MERKRLKVVITRALPREVETRMQELFDVELNAEDKKLDRADLIAAMQKADVLVPCITDQIDADMISEAGGRLKLIANYGVGIEHIDIAAARARGIQVSNTPGVVAEDTADMAIALMLAVMRRMPEGDQLMQRGDWTGWAPTAFLGQRVNGKTLGILGMGRIGQAVARRARAFGLNVLYNNRRRLHEETEADLGITWFESLDQMLSRIDILSINTPHTPATYHLINARRLKLMKPTSVIVNTSRGEVVDENALTRGLRAGEIGGAGLDVFERGHQINPRLRDLPNVVLLPHMGSATVEGRREMGERVLLNICNFADGVSPPDMVLP
ncbi:2-hydroxyacid dehydrogenase [Celeribacter litoreus]|uniref:2-hydroxyacid dehydrogenase n=1 Tax=Celeribacter litoreus TaxID=2876714 RepID=UPI001CCCBF66|nr:D-glycerate dehydrogenase [Celeribacter litoreus]MCA0042701.1 D-glycerate dehydrogenase [Celeribacter litoreus]